MESKGLNKKIIIGAAALIVMIAAFLIIFNVFREKPVQGSKSITLEVLNQEKQTSECGAFAPGYGGSKRIYL